MLCLREYRLPCRVPTPAPRLASFCEYAVPVPHLAEMCSAMLCCCSVCRLELSSMGPLKTLPYLVMFLMSNAGGWAGDALILRQHRSVAAARKAVNTLGECCASSSYI
jgi:hypothetical protein